MNLRPVALSKGTCIAHCFVQPAPIIWGRQQSFPARLDIAKVQQNLARKAQRGVICRAEDTKSASSNLPHAFNMPVGDDDHGIDLSGAYTKPHALQDAPETLTIRN